MHGGIAEIGGHGITTVSGLDTFEVGGYFVEGFVPSDLLPAGARATDRMFQPVLIEVDVLQRNCLWADISVTEGIVFVSTNIQRAVIALSYLNAADGFADAAIAIVN